MKVIFVTENLGSNSTGRTYCLWQLAQFLGWETKVISVRGEGIWAPMRGTDFARYCSLLDESSVLEQVSIFGPDIIVGVKPHPWSLGIAAHIAENLRLPLLVDIDDPDLEGKLSWHRPLIRAARAVLRPRETRDYLRMDRLVRTTPRSVGNPVLQHRYGGTLVPHVRPTMTPLRKTQQNKTEGAIEVVFVGTPGAHKGIDVLRAAVSRVQQDGFTLTVTAAPPTDAKPWENWVGETTLQGGLQIVERAGVVAVPSLRTVASRGQFPVKLLDAMFLGKAIVTTSVDPIPWVVGDGAQIIRPGSIGALVAALRQLKDPMRRSKLGRSARKRALSEFSIERVAPGYAALVLDTIRSFEGTGTWVVD